jgi:hypothetical protein
MSMTRLALVALCSASAAAMAQTDDGGMPVQPMAANPGTADAPSQLIREGFEGDAGVEAAPEATTKAPTPTAERAREEGGHRLGPRHHRCARCLGARLVRGHHAVPDRLVR